MEKNGFKTKKGFLVIIAIIIAILFCIFGQQEEIRKVAIEKLGMHYASEGQIVTYTENYANDYVKVLSVIN